jgi:two-component system NtrC family sensor kinase
LEAELKELDAALVVPSFIDEKLLVLIILGKKLSNKLYSEDDLAVFTILAGQAGLAIENAMFYEDMKATHEQLFKAEKMATIGTMADGLSHQINNRLHALGFIAGDVLDTIKLKKNTQMSTGEVKEMLIDIEHALSRIQDNVAQGGDIVQGLLKYTRKGEEGFSEVDLNQLLDACIEMTQFKIKPGEIRILREFDASIPKMRGNFTQLQEVFFNLIDNAYDAMMQRKAELHEEGYKPEIKISAQSGNNGDLDIYFEDNGMGIKENDKEKLFTPFFSTKLSSKKGTGLGLYVIQKLIQDNHGGKVSYFSKYMQGTKVHIKIPIYS